MTKLSWKQDGYLHFAHAKEGMYMIEQKRRKYIVTLTLAIDNSGAHQDMGQYDSMPAAKAGAQRDHRALEKVW